MNQTRHEQPARFTRRRACLKRTPVALEVRLLRVLLQDRMREWRALELGLTLKVGPHFLYLTLDDLKATGRVLRRWDGPTAYYRLP